MDIDIDMDLGDEGVAIDQDFQLEVQLSQEPHIQQLTTSRTVKSPRSFPQAAQ